MLISEKKSKYWKQKLSCLVEHLSKLVPKYYKEIILNKSYDWLFISPSLVIHVKLYA